MAHKFLAYFKSENDAETTSAHLQKMNVSNVLVDRIPEGAKGILLLPAANLGTGATGMGAAGAPGLVGKVGRIGSLKDLWKSESEKSDTFSHILEFEVEEEDHEEALKVLRDSDAYIDENFGS